MYDNIYSEISEAAVEEADVDALRQEADEVNTSVEFGGWGTSNTSRLIEEKGELRFIPGRGIQNSASTSGRATSSGRPGDLGDNTEENNEEADDDDTDGILDIDVDSYILDEFEQVKR